MNLLKKVRIEAPAKINLFLHVVGRRSYGYHDVETLMQKIDLHDTVHLQAAAENITLACTDHSLPTDRNNLAFQAAQIFFDTLSMPQGVEIILEKKIPVAAGLGGGSSDAAAVLVGLNQLYGTKLSGEQLVNLARPLGADVPFFVCNKSVAWATGIGDHLEEVAIRLKYWTVLVNPGFSVATKWVYQNFALTSKGNPYILGRGKKDIKKVSIIVQGKNIPLYNDLETVTIAEYPVLHAIKQDFLSMGARDSLMSGSGPTVFGLFDDKADAVACADQFKKKFGKNVFLTKFCSAE